MPIPTLTTPRLTLRAFTETDVEPLHRLLGQGDVLRYFPQTAPPSLERVQKMVAGILRHWEERGYGWWAVELRQAPELIGWNGLTYLPETDEVEVTYLLGRPFWGQGYATEGAQASLRYGFEQVGAETIVGIVHPENIASQRVLEKLGMSRTERTSYFGMDCYRYAIDRAKWVDRNSAPLQ
jgi:RimJ/RimL family protein N-acetyltransferase